MARFGVLALLLVLGAGQDAWARWMSGEHVQLRVMVTSVAVRSGPGGSFPEIARAGADQIFPVLEKSPDGAWYRIRLTRGIAGWVFGELCWLFEVAEEGEDAAPTWLEDNLLGQSGLGDGKIAMTLSGGVLGTDGLFLVRLGFQPSQAYLLELTLGQTVSALGSFLFYQGQLLVAIGPWRAVVPFAAVGAGGSTFLPHRSVEVFRSTTNPMICGGGGLLVSLHGSVTLRVDVQRQIIFSPDSTWGALSVVGGAMITY